MSDMDNKDDLLRGFPSQEVGCECEGRNVEMESSRPRQEVVQNCEDFRSLLHTNSRENSETTNKTARRIHSEITS